MANIYQEMVQSLNAGSSKVAKLLVARRLVPIDEKITTEMADGVRKVLANMEIESNNPITLLIDSGGGCLQSAMDIGVFMNCLHSPVDGLVIGRCDSAAIDILFQCRKKMALPNASFLIHFTRRRFDLIMDTELGDKELKLLHDQAVQESEAWYKKYIERLGITREEVIELCRLGESCKMRYGAEEALKMHLIDEIVRDFKLFEKKS